MAIHAENMEEVAAFGELVPAGWYLARVSKVEEKTSNTSGNPIVEFTFTIQDEGEAFGRTVRSWPSLQKHALGHLKAIYKACGYVPGPEGHDPEQCLDASLYICLVAEMYEGKDSRKIPPYGYHSLTEGPGKK